MKSKRFSQSRRDLGRYALGVLLAVAGGRVLAGETMTVYKSPSCGCCGSWAEHMKSNGFDVRIREVPDVAPYERKLGVPPALASCHVALVAGYAIEGHVPASDVKRLLRERPRAAGLAVPGMPVGSPGMEQGARRDRYETLLFDSAGKFGVFERH